MKRCTNCIWADKCGSQNERCDDYYPVQGEEYVAIKEYKEDLKERAKIYQEIVDEQNS